MFRLVVLLTIVLVSSGCADDIDSPRRTYQELRSVAFSHAGSDAVDCGSGDISDITIISCLLNSFNNGTPAVGIFWSSGSVNALSFRDNDQVTEYVYHARAPERDGDGKKAITEQYLCTNPTTNTDSASGHTAFGCSERILVN